MASFGDLLKGVFGSRNDRTVKALLPLVERVNALEPTFARLPDEALRAKTPEFRKRLAAGETLDDLLPEAFAACREAAKRTIGLRHFDVQIIGATVLHRGMIAEMVTGEGKTLVATPAVYLNALAGQVHVVTVNDYLARRDAEWMRPVYETLGIKVGAIQAHMHSSERIPIYRGDIVYGTNSEFGFDYLRDHMKVRVEDQCQRALRYAVVDEVDSILIDEARTPLIISGPAEDDRGLYEEADAIARKLRRGEDFEVKEKEHQCILTDEGYEKAEKLAGVSFFEGGVTDWPHLIETALRAHNIYQRDVDYVAHGDEIVIVDEFTGRTMPGRRWSDGLHQAVEAKEGIRVQEENQTLATITYQNFFKLYRKLGGMTGTAATEAAEFWSIYKLDVVSIPTNRPLVRTTADDRIYRTEKEKFGAVVEEILEVHKTGRPILVGTTSIEKSERVSGMLQRRGVPHAVLNAKQHDREAIDRRPGRTQGRSRSRPTWPAAAPTSSSEARPARPAACTSSAPSATSRGASTTSCAAARAARATRAPRSSSSRSRTTSCGSSPPSGWGASSRGSACRRARRSPRPWSARPSRARRRRSRPTTSRSARTSSSTTRSWTSSARRSTGCASRSSRATSSGSTASSTA